VSEPFLGEIRMFGGTFAPRGWALCDGQLLSISSNSALFSLLGTTYGGDGLTTFALPDLRGRVPIHMGSGPGLTNRRIGEKAGVENVTISAAQLPTHTHTMGASSQAGDSASPTGAVPAAVPLTARYSASPAAAGNEMNGAAVGSAGGNQPHANLQPFQCVNFIIALLGIYPSRA
jgi:microcystin-dependent protein